MEGMMLNGKGMFWYEEISESSSVFLVVGNEGT